mmetsp:Transcript_18488/g.21353  ORF Transcript_18488/g.21353 Transcript_18488/m.21353 type:complete len:141 (+) Transcript_18488:51-473(+)
MDFNRLKENIYSDCSRRAYAGAIIGTICGFMFGAMDAGRVSGLTSDYTKVLEKIKSPVVTRVFFRQNMLTTVLFGGMFTTYQVTKCALDNYGPQDWDNIPQSAVACVVGLAPVIGFRNMRRNLPYALVLVGMDVYQGGLK